MLFKIDENISNLVADFIRNKGHDLHTVYDENLNGKPDRQVITAAGKEKRILLTLDSDFSNIRNYPPEKYAGIIFFRLHSQDNPSVMKAVEKPLALLNSTEITGSLWVVTETEIRIKQNLN